jgi:hypothetical protein
VQLRVLQSSLLLVSSLQSRAMSEELLSQALLVCFALASAAKDGAVRHAALATVRQTLSMLFDRVAAAASQADAEHRHARHALALAQAAWAQGEALGPLPPPSDAATADEAGAGRRASAWKALEAAAAEAAACGKAAESAALAGVGRCAYLVFQDLCVLSRGEQGVWLKRTSVAAATGLELVESVLSQQPRLFLHDAMFATLVSRQASVW